jgi:hypothetical protein
LKKIFKLTAENKKPERVLDSIKYDIRRYLKRERKKKLPEDATFWDFECAFGKSSDDKKEIIASEITNALDKASEESWEACYIEIIAKAVTKERKVEVKPTEEKSDSEDSESENEEA